ncbi:hypothetical protein, partial [Turicibacter bilis]|uniref:hypothetical protein n=1 Tax=Turicibacter bilis TaxID=2735723 RepID=UPI0031BBA550
MKKIISMVTVASTLGSSLISGVTPALAEDEVTNNEATLENEYVEENVNEGEEVNNDTEPEEL